MVDHLPVVVTVVLIVPIYGPHTTAVLRGFSYHCSYILISSLLGLLLSLLDSCVIIAVIIAVVIVIIIVVILIGIHTDEYLHCPQIISFSWVLSL
jgi:hypothetical protein